MGLVLAFYLRDVGSIPAHSTKGSEGCICGGRMSILGVVRIPHKAVGPVSGQWSRCCPDRLVT